MDIVKCNFSYITPLTPLNLNNVQYIILHHAEAVTASPEDIQQWHLENGWSGAGYNEYIRKDGTVYIMRGDNVGAQCYNYNSISYGICCEGNYDTEKIMPKAQYASMIQRLKSNKPRFPNIKKIGGHKEFYSTACPGLYFPLQRAIKESNEQNTALTEAINILLAEKVITNGTLWAEKALSVQYLDVLIENMANKIKELKGI